MGKRKYPQVCKQCGNDYLSQKRDSNYCSKDCSNKSRIGKQRPDEYKKKMSDFWKKERNIPEAKKKYKDTWIKNLPKNAKGDKNGNWKGGKTREYTNYRIQNYTEYYNWRKKCIKRDGGKCKICGSMEKLQVHHIIPISLLRKAAWEVWNGVTLCRNCHKENDKCIKEGKRYSNDTISKLSTQKVLVFTIRLEFQEYRTAGNYKELSDGTVIYLITKQEKRDYEFLILIHEMVEYFLCKKRGIKEEDIDKYDKYWEIRKSKGKAKAEEPGNEDDCPYKLEHRFAENIERLLAHEAGRIWRDYDNEIIPLDLI